MKSKEGELSKMRSSLKGIYAIGVLALPSIACRVTSILTEPDPIYSFARGALGVAVVEAELGMGKLVDYGLHKATNVPLGCLAILASVIPPVIVGAISVEYPAVGYIALALPIIAGLSYIGRR